MARPDLHRSALVAAAVDRMRTQGYAATSLNQVLQDAGAPNGSLYHHFPGGKEDLALSAVQEAGAAISRTLEATLAVAEDPAVAVAQWARTLARRLREGPREGCPIAPVALEAPAISGALQEAAAAAFTDWETVLGDHLVRARGWEREAAANTAALVIASIEGALLLDRTAGTTRHLELIAENAARLLTP